MRRVLLLVTVMSLLCKLACVSSGRHRCGSITSWQKMVLLFTSSAERNSAPPQLPSDQCFSWLVACTVLLVQTIVIRQMALTRRLAKQRSLSEDNAYKQDSMYHHCMIWFFWIQSFKICTFSKIPSYWITHYGDTVSDGCWWQKLSVFCLWCNLTRRDA